MAKIDGVQEVRLDSLKPYEKNAKVHGQEQVNKIADSIREFGFLSPLLIDKDYNIIAGHGRVMAAKQLGMETVPAVFIEGLTETQRRAYILADNKLTELGGWDAVLVSSELDDLKASGFDIDLTGFSIDDIIIDESAGAEFTEDELDDLKASGKDPRIQPGEVWQLGEHRIMCGDSTKAEDVKKLMGGELADLLLTDPPYNVDYEGGTKDKLKIEGDNMDEIAQIDFLQDAFVNAWNAMKPGAAYYCWCASMTQKAFHIALENSGLKPHQLLIWVKNGMVLGRQDYQWRHEPCFYGWKEGGAHYFIDVRSFSTVEDDTDKLTREKAIERLKELAQFSTAIYEDKPHASELHPTMKPVELFKKQIRNSSRPGDLVLDLFAGSGTAIIAAEEMERRCYSMEYDPQYAEVIIQRWEDKTGQIATKIEEVQHGKR